MNTHTYTHTHTRARARAQYLIYPFVANKGKEFYNLFLNIFKYYYLYLPTCLAISLNIYTSAQGYNKSL